MYFLSIKEVYKILSKKKEQEDWNNAFFSIK